MKRTRKSIPGRRAADAEINEEENETSTGEGQVAGDGDGEGKWWGRGVGWCGKGITEDSKIGTCWSC